MKEYDKLNLIAVSDNGDEFKFAGDNTNTILTVVDELLFKHGLELYTFETENGEYYLNIKKGNN